MAKDMNADAAAVGADQVRLGPKAPFGWAIVQSKKGEEKKAEDSLERKGFEVYLPMTMRLDTRFNMVRTYGAPFFPSYLFVKLTLQTERWWNMQHALGVAKVHGSSAANPYALPRCLRDEVLQKIREREEAGYVKIAAASALPPRPVFDRGQRVRIVGGLFDSFEVVFQEHVDEKRSFLLASLIGRSDSRKLFVDWNKLSAAQD